MFAVITVPGTISDTAGQIRTVLAARPNIAYLVATFGAGLFP